jgi:uncharacterized protein YcbK (DUF882 family)
MERKTSSSLTRRQMLSGLAAVAAGAILSPGPVVAALPAKGRGVTMLHQRTGEILETTYHDGRGYLAEALEAFNHFARDLRTESATTMDMRLLDLVHLIQQDLGDDAPVVLTNGYRSKATNARIRQAASGSLHVQGQALDITHPRGAAVLHRAAAGITQGGLGRYRTFVHIDTGPNRRW